MESRSLNDAESRVTTRSELKRSRKSIKQEYAEAFLFAIILTIFIRTFVVQAFRIPSGSMENTLLVGDFLFVNKFLYGARIPMTNMALPAIREPRRGDVIVFKYPEDTRKDFIKRVVGLPGETMEIRDKVVYINGQPIDEAHVRFSDDVIKPRSVSERRIYPPGSANGNKDNYGPITIPSGHLFMMGDNRDNSEDSRFWGFLDQDLIKGKAIILYWSWDLSKKLLGFFPEPRLDRIGRLIR